MSVSVRKPDVPATVSLVREKTVTKRHTVLALGARLVKHHVVDIEIGNVAHVKGHDVVVTRTDVVVGNVTSAIGLGIAGGHQLLDHLEDITQLAGVQ